MKRIARDDSGAVAVTVAILLVVFMILSALVVDMGYWYNVRRQMQAAADSAALAGCWELANDNDNDVIWAAVTEYAGNNAVVPVDAIEVVPPSPGGMSDITDDSVKVTVQTTSGSFFARVLGIGETQIAAQAVAKVGYLTGARNPVPWALPILRVDRMVATMNGNDYNLTEDANGVWSKWLPAGATGDVFLTAWNDQTIDPAYPDGVPEMVPPTGDRVARAIQLPVDSKVFDIWVDKTTFTSGLGESVTVRVDVVAPLDPNWSVVATIDGKNDKTLTQTGPTTYVASLGVPQSDDLCITRTLAIEIKDDKNKTQETVSPAAILLVRRSTYPIKDVRVGRTVFRNGAVGQVHIEAELNDYEYGTYYELKVIGGAGEAGNFMAVDFHLTFHDPYWDKSHDPVEYPDLPSGTSTYYEYIAGTPSYDFILHIDDTVWTETGNMSGPTTEKSLDTRFGDEPSDFDGWVAASMPPSRRVVYVPITEKVQTTTGQTPLRIVAFAAFYIEDYDKSGTVAGRFVEYAGPGWVVGDEPPDSKYIVKTPYLTSENLDF